jgi:putative flippase GtrA
MTENLRRTGLRWLKFNAVGGIGIAVQLAVLWVLTAWLHVNYLVATALEAAVIHNFLWHERFTWADRLQVSASQSLVRFLKFNLTTGAFSILGNLLLMRLFVGVAHLPYVPANLVTIATCSIVNFLVSDRFVFRGKQVATRQTAGSYAGSCEAGSEREAGASASASPKEIRAWLAASAPERTQSGTPIPR